MSNVPSYTGTVPNRTQAQSEFNTNVQAFLSYIALLAPEINNAVAEIAALESLESYSSTVTYNTNDACIGSNGVTYRCTADGVTGDDPVTSSTGNWKNITLYLGLPDQDGMMLKSTTDGVLSWAFAGLGEMPSGIEMEGSFVGGDYTNGTDAVNDIDIQPFVFPSHDNTDIISSTAVITAATDGSGANGMLGGAKQSGDILDIWALKGTSGTCVGFTRNGSETIGGVTLPSGYADAYKWIGTTGLLDVTDLPTIVCVGNQFTYLYDLQAIFSGVSIGTTYELKSLSGILPDDRYYACRFGLQDNDSAQVAFSIDGVNDYYTVDTSTAGMTSWGYRMTQPSGHIPILDNQIYVKQSIANATALLMQAALLRR